jgi:transposase-like protein
MRVVEWVLKGGYPMKCQHCGSDNTVDTSTYNTTVFSDHPAYRFKCRDCGKVSWYPVKQANKDEQK